MITTIEMIHVRVKHQIPSDGFFITQANALQTFPTQ